MEPEPTATQKYSKEGGFSVSSFTKLGVTRNWADILVEASNFSVSANTWRSYKTAENHIIRFEKLTGIVLTFPFSLKSTLSYIAFLLASKEEGGRAIQGKSVEKYLSALRMAHMQRGYFSPWIRPEIVKQITTGACNRDQLIKRLEGKGGRQAMTPSIMRLLKIKLSNSNMKISRKRIIWAVSCICWAGALRVHEVLS